ncbi:hypothetical protein BaRGS_00028331 [Batillaria attramentaria]|uniref:Cyclic nucleotide-binding domain-containing protein n=1 Tax=Batillaria attramentaria TaxID=370345 RepID=A0ABD0JZD9_9CAEN
MGTGVRGKQSSRLTPAQQGSLPFLSAVQSLSEYQMTAYTGYTKTSPPTRDRLKNVRRNTGEIIMRHQDEDSVTSLNYYIIVGALAVSATRSEKYRMVL